MINYWTDSNTVLLQSDENNLVKSLQLIPSSIDINKTEYSDPLEDLKVERDAGDEIYFRIQEITVNGVDYVDIEGTIVFHSANINGIKNKIMLVSIYKGVKAKDKDRDVIKSVHRLTKKAELKIKDDIKTEYQSVFSSDLEKINSLLLDLTVKDIVSKSQAEIERLNELISAATDIS